MNEKMKKSSIAIILIVALVVYLFSMYGRKGADTDALVYQHRQGMVFGTVYNITYAHNDSVDMLPHIENALAAVNNSLSMFNKESVISRVNGNDSTVVLDSLFVRVFECGQRVSEQTGGAFDMTVAPLVDVWGFGLDDRAAVDTSMVKEIMEYVGYAGVRIESGRVVKDDERVRLDAGAIAKGFACDVVVDTLRAYGCENYCVEIGGELAVRGKNPQGKAWRIGVNKPVEDSLSINNDIQEVIELTEGGMATSGNYRNYYVDAKGRKVSHTINPVTGFPIEHSLLSATIVAKDCMTADALATACMVMGLEESIRLVNGMEGVRGYFIYSDEGGELKSVSVSQ